MKKVFILIPIFIIVSFTQSPGQELIDLPTAPRVDTADTEVKAVYDLWSNHLSEKPDEVYDNPYWSEQQKEQWHDYDISRRWTYGYELSQGMNMHQAFGLEPRVLSIEKEDSLYAIRTLYAPDNLEGAQEIYSIQRVYADREEGQWKLFSALPTLTRDWNREVIGDIKYIFPPDFPLDRKEAQDSASFVQGLKEEFDLTVANPITYYLARSYDEMALISGLDYAWDGNDGRSYPKNNQVFIGTGSETYPHELVHTLFKNYELHHFASEGLATYLGGIGDQSFDQMISSVAERIQADKSLTLEKVITGQGIPSNIYYVGGAVLIKAAEEKGGSNAVKNFLNLASNEDGIYKAMKEVLGIEKEDNDNYWKKKIKEYST